MLLIKKLKNIAKNIFFRLVLLFLLAWLLPCQTALATESCTSPSIAPETFNLSGVSLSLSPIPRDATVGTLIYNSGPLPYAVTLLTCTTSVYATAKYADSANMVQSAIPGVYNTNIPGIGVKVIETHNNTVVSNDVQVIVPGSIKFNNSGYSCSYRLELYVTGQVVPGSQTALTLPSRLVDCPTSDNTTTLVNSYLADYLNISGSAPLTASTCDITQSDITVQLPLITTTTLNGPGSTTGTTPFSLGLICDNNIKVSYQIDATSPYSQTNGVLNNSTSAGMASGVGVQLLQGNQSPLPLSTQTAVITTSSANQPVNIPLQAQYYQTGAGVTAGAVNATATFTMNYK